MATKLSKFAPLSKSRSVKVSATGDLVDHRLVDEATSWIREKLAKTAFRAIAEIGEYLFQRFYDGDPERVRSHDSTKAVSLNKLTERCGSTELPIGRDVLYKAVAVAVLLKELPPGATAYPRLPPTHQATLLPLRDTPDTVEWFAQRALAEKQSVRVLHGEVKDEVARRPRNSEKRGRPSTPQVVKTLDGSLRLFTLDHGRRTFTRAQIDELSDAQVRHAVKTAKELAASLESLTTRLRARSEA